jgi:hypothetical protein
MNFGFCMSGLGIMARPKRNHKLRWASKSANKGRKPSRGRIKGWSVKNYGIY